MTADEKILKELPEKGRGSVEYAFRQIEQSPLLEHINRIILYGSMARGDSTYKSDVDMFIEFDGKLNTDDRQTRADIRLLRCEVIPNYPFPEVDLHTAVGTDWTESPKTYYKNILKDGKILWQKG